LAVDTSIFDLLAFGTQAGALKSSVAVLVCQEVWVMTLEMAAGHDIRVIHLVGSVKLTVSVHLRRRGVVRVVARMLLLLLLLLLLL